MLGLDPGPFAQLQGWLHLEQGKGIQELFKASLGTESTPAPGAKLEPTTQPPRSGALDRAARAED